MTVVTPYLHQLPAQVAGAVVLGKVKMVEQVARVEGAVLIHHPVQLERAEQEQLAKEMQVVPGYLVQVHIQVEVAVVLVLLVEPQPIQLWLQLVALAQQV